MFVTWSLCAKDRRKHKPAVCQSMLSRDLCSVSAVTMSPYICTDATSDVQQQMVNNSLLQVHFCLLLVSVLLINKPLRHLPAGVLFQLLLGNNRLHALFPWFECNIWGFYFSSLFRKHRIWLAMQVLLAVYPHLQLLKRLTGFYWYKVVLIEVRGHYLYHSKQGFQLFLGRWQVTVLFLHIRPDASFSSENSKCAESLWTCIFFDLPY